MAKTGIPVPVKPVLQELDVKRISTSAYQNLVKMAASVLTRKMDLSVSVNLHTQQKPAVKVRHLVLIAHGACEIDFPVITIYFCGLCFFFGTFHMCFTYIH